MAINKLVPHRQGDLDGLCGFYSIANALNRLLNQAQFRDYIGNIAFEDAATAVQKSLWPNLLWEGITHPQLVKAAKAVCARYAASDLEIRVEIPFRKREFRSAHHFLDILQHNASLNKFSVAIIGIEWPVNMGCGHWTVFQSFSEDSLLTFDGAKQRRHPTKNVKIRGERGLRIVPRETTVLRLTSIGGEGIDSAWRIPASKVS